ncbi:hypothetical protein [Methanolobus sp.]|uniref:helix-turn-helix transcriptional regulator n=1 Tax=Methanolobus sp. TaxID=1874737 RepID=UPI0025E0676A|nr:hypothetical protein [Methanolobus sp.]
MKATYIASCIAIIFLFLWIVPVGATATVHGTTYEWNTFNPLNNSLIEVNSTPEQSMVAKYGFYSFELPNGTYLINASFFEDDKLTYYDEEVITISDNGSYVVDMLLLPAYTGIAVEDSIVSVDHISVEYLFPLPLLLVLVLLVMILYKFKKRSQAEMVTRTEIMGFSLDADKQYLKMDLFHDDTKSVSSSDIFVTKTHESNFPVKEAISTGSLSSEHQEILDIIQSHGGTMAQKDLRKHLEYSEGKVSVMLLNLEKWGKLRKVREGRGNILFFTESDL